HYTLDATKNVFTILEHAATSLTVSAPAYNSSGVPNICNNQTVTNKNGSGSSRSSISVLIIF
ncbi:hypothetical protein A2U01_0059846, partial [Trifolium medium]|nr:hypothetical protein [Trifolium medium]